MSRIYYTILVLGICFVVAQFAKVVKSGTQKTFVFNVEATESITLVPDTIEIQFARKVDFAESPSDAALLAEASIKKFLKDIDASYLTTPVTVFRNRLENDTGIAYSHGADKQVTVKLSDFSKVPSLIKLALSSELNAISFRKFSNSSARLQRAKSEAKAKAYRTAQKRAEEIAESLGLRIAPFARTSVAAPASDPVVGSGSVYESGAGDAWSIEELDESMLETDIAKATVPIRSFMRSISAMTIDEPPFDGAILIAQTLIPEMTIVEQSVSLPFNFTK